jgi:hypothetical protein
MFMAWIALSGARPLSAQVEYTADGIPDGLEEAVRWHMNRARFDRTSENNMRGTSYTDIPASSGPLAPANSLMLAARHHTEDMAMKNKFQNETVPGSAYYDSASQSQPFQRMVAEGYGSYSIWGESLSASVPTSEETFVGWWKSAGHRQNIGNAAFLEIGIGHYFWGSSDYGHYWAMDLMAGGSSFLTDTLFFDTDGNSKYTPGEGVNGVRVFLRINGAEHTTHDVTAGSGSFAVPLNGIDVAQSVEVWLTNQNATVVSLSIPRDYHTFELLTLSAGQSMLIGTFSRSAFAVNFGFRNLIEAPAPVVRPLLTLTKTGPTVQVAWPSQTDLQYLAQWSSDLGAWTDFSGGYKNGTGGVMSQMETTTTARRYYRVMVRKL